MESTMMAVYEKGLLRPLSPLILPEHARVRVRVEQVLSPTDAPQHRRQIQAALVAAGLSLPTSSPTASREISAERREELARRFAAGQPLSELIVAEREGR
jgi:predicted DNA-binding antitoxin AbrB/MazE fold protein